MGGPFYKVERIGKRGNPRMGEIAKVCKKCEYFLREDETCCFDFCIKFMGLDAEDDDDGTAERIGFSE